MRKRFVLLSNKCNGGSIEQGANFYLVKGGVSSKCIPPYNFCKADCKGKNADMALLNDAKFLYVQFNVNNGNIPFKLHYAKSIKRFSMTGKETNYIKEADYENRDGYIWILAICRFYDW